MSHDSSPLLSLELKIHQYWLKHCKKSILPLKIYLSNVSNGRSSYLLQGVLQKSISNLVQLKFFFENHEGIRLPQT